jgi:hypothetical protein
MEINSLKALKDTEGLLHKKCSYLSNDQNKLKNKDS